MLFDTGNEPVLLILGGNNVNNVRPDPAPVNEERGPTGKMPPL
jgi:hypothetical protein